MKWGDCGMSNSGAYLAGGNGEWNAAKDTFGCEFSLLCSPLVERKGGAGRLENWRMKICWEKCFAADRSLIQLYCVTGVSS